MNTQSYVVNSRLVKLPDRIMSELNKDRQQTHTLINKGKLYPYNSKKRGWNGK